MGTDSPQGLVVVGASAGGVDALGQLVEGLPEDFPAPIVVAQHLDPRRASHLGEILARRTSLPVVTIADREKMRPGSIYLVPADRNVDIVDGVVRVDKEPDNVRPKPSVDRLFGSAADAYGESLVAVVLTGTGSDGADGARLVKASGGTVVIQDPATATHPSMPQSLAPNTVDLVARLDVMGQLLVDVLTGAFAPKVEGDQQFFDRFLAQVRDHTGIDFGAYKRPTILRRLHRRMTAVGAKDLRDYARRAARDPAEYARLAATFLINVTEFFRDPDLFEELRNRIVPKLVADAAAGGRELRIWSAGCATGEEPYSLAILVAEALGEDVRRLGVRVFATDLDAEAISFARRGIYSRAAVAAVPEDLLERYFTGVGDDYEIRQDIRAMTVFGQHDLAQRAPFPRIDLVLSRNVLIYFTTELQRRALQLFSFSLRDGGYLVLGKAESISPAAEHFAIEHPRLRVYRRHGDRVVIPPSRLWPASAAPPAEAVLFPARRTASGVGTVPLDARPTVADRVEQVLLRLPVGVVAVADGYEIQLINGEARRLLGIHGRAVGLDFVHLAREIPSQLLRDGIDGARQGREVSVNYERVGAASGADLQTLRLTFRVDAAGDEPDPAGRVLLVVTDVTDAVREAGSLSADLRQAQDDATALNRRVAAIEESNRVLLAANRDLTMENADLRSANEDLLVSSEEVQAATEEVETLNEELQATNEELETLNEELQATVEELNTTNDDLQARSLEVEVIVQGAKKQERRA